MLVRRALHHDAKGHLLSVPRDCRGQRARSQGDNPHTDKARRGKR